MDGRGCSGLAQTATTSYRRQGGYIFIGVNSLVFCLFFSRITQKQLIRFAHNSVEMWHMNTTEKTIRF